MNAIDKAISIFPNIDKSRIEGIVNRIFDAVESSFATLIKQMEKSTIDFEDIEELDKIQKSINNHLGELQKNKTNSSIVVNNISSINKDDYDSVKKLINNCV